MSGESGNEPASNIVFVSSTSTDLGSCRTLVCKALRAAGHDARFQDDFEHGYQPLEDFLRDRIAACHAVICLVGFEFGSKPEGHGERRSYTQIEYDVAASTLSLPVFVFFASEAFIPDERSGQDDSAAALQREHRSALARSHVWRQFSSRAELRKQIDEFACQLPRILPLQLFGNARHEPPRVFTGRVAELEQLGQAVRRRSPSVIAVIGMAGQGKSTLLDRWLRQQPRNNWVRGAWFDASRLGFDGFLDGTLSRFLGDAYDKRETPDLLTRTDALLQEMREEPTVVVLDALERWLEGWAAGEDQLAHADTVMMRAGRPPELDLFLRQAATLTTGSHLIVSSRALPAALDDVSCTIVPVREEEGIDGNLEGLDETAAVRLLREHKIRGVDSELAAVAVSFGCHPLALTVLGGLLKKKYGGCLEYAPRVDPLDPLRALRGLLDESARHLPAGELGRRFLSVAAQAIEHPPLAAVAAAMTEEGADEDELRDLAVTLADWHLLIWDGARQIVAMHALVQKHFGASLAQDEVRAINRRLMAWYDGLALPSAPTSLPQIAPRLLAIEHALRADEPQSCVTLVFRPLRGTHGLPGWASLWGHHTVAIELLGRVARAMEGAECAAILVPRAALRRQLGQLEPALEDLDRAIELLDPGSRLALTHELVNLAGALNNRGNVLRQLSRPAEALRDLDRALEALELLPSADPERLLHTPGTRMNRGIALREMGRLGDAEIDCRRAVVEYRERTLAIQSPVPRELARACLNHGIVLADLELHPAALDAFAEAIAVLERLISAGRREFVPDLARARVARAGSLTESGDGCAALVELESALESLHPFIQSGRADLEASMAHAYLARSQAHLLLCDWPAARQAADKAVSGFESIIEAGRVDLDTWLAQALANRAEATHALGHRAKAKVHLARSLGLFKKRIALGEPETRVMYLRKSCAAAVYLAAHEPQHARSTLEGAVVQVEQGLANGETVEALRLEARRAARELQASTSLSDLRLRLEKCGGHP